MFVLIQEPAARIPICSLCLKVERKNSRCSVDEETMLCCVDCGRCGQSLFTSCTVCGNNIIFVFQSRNFFQFTELRDLQHHHRLNAVECLVTEPLGAYTSFRLQCPK